MKLWTAFRSKRITMKKILLLLLVLPFIVTNCASEAKKGDLYSVIKKDSLFQDYLKTFKAHNIIFTDNAVYFDKKKKKEYRLCYRELAALESCSFNDYSSCNVIKFDAEFLSIAENNCRKGKLLLKLKEKYPEMDKEILSMLLDDSYKNGFATEMLQIKSNKK